MMKKIFTLALACFSLLVVAQTRNVGINTSVPEATLDIYSQSETIPIVRIGTTATNSNHRFRVMNNGNQIYGNFGLTGFPVTIYTLRDGHADFAIIDANNPNLFLKHYHINQNMLNGSQGPELAGYGINFTVKTGHLILFSSDGLDSGLFLGSVTDNASGLYIGENGKNGIGIISKPTETLDIGGNLRIGSDSTTASENAPCSRPGEIMYSINFWGCTSTGWKKLNN